MKNSYFKEIQPQNTHLIKKKKNSCGGHSTGISIKGLHTRFLINLSRSHYVERVGAH